MALKSEEWKERIAKICHEANRAFCETLGDFTQPPWDEAPQWQKDSALRGVEFHLSGEFYPSASHESWLAEKIQTGWKYGPVKDAEKKEHPCMVPYNELPRDQQLKDSLFRGIVHSFKHHDGINRLSENVSGHWPGPGAALIFTEIKSEESETE